MAEAIGRLLPFAVGVAISPMPIVAVVLLLVTPRARVNGPAFVVGWIVGLAVAGAIFLAIAKPANANSDGAPADWVGWLKLVLGILLLLVAVHGWRGRPRAGEEAPAPKWMGALDSFTPAKAAAAGIALSALNPKNLLLVLGGASAVAQLGVSTGEEVVAWIVFVVLATIGVGAPVAIYFFAGPRAATLLDELKTWMAHNNAAIMAVLCLVIGAKLIGDAITQLAG
jgi:hypothetical protein